MKKRVTLDNDVWQVETTVKTTYKASGKEDIKPATLLEESMAQYNDYTKLERG